LLLSKKGGKGGCHSDGCDGRGGRALVFFDAPCPVLCEPQRRPVNCIT
jgi:hypothetical protein